MNNVTQGNKSNSSETVPNIKGSFIGGMIEDINLYDANDDTKTNYKQSSTIKNCNYCFCHE